MPLRHRHFLCLCCRDSRPVWRDRGQCPRFSGCLETPWLVGSLVAVWWMLAFGADAVARLPVTTTYAKGIFVAVPSTWPPWSFDFNSSRWAYPLSPANHPKVFTIFLFLLDNLKYSFYPSFQTVIFCVRAVIVPRGAFKRDTAPLLPRSLCEQPSVTCQSANM